MAEYLGDGRVREIVRRHVDRLNRGDGSTRDRGDAFLKLGDLAGKSGLIADARRQTAKQPGDLAARLNQAIDVINQQEHVLMRLVAEVLGDGERRQPGAPASAGRLVHLSEHEGRAREHARLFEFEEQFVPLARALANSRKDGDSGMPLDRGADQLRDEYCLAHPGAAEHGGLAALHQRGQEVDDLDAGMKNFEAGLKPIDGGRRRMDRAELRIGRKRRPAVGGLSDGVEKPAKHCLADRHADG